MIDWLIDWTVTYSILSSLPASDIPYRVCHTDILTHNQCSSKFDIQKFKEFAQKIVSEKDAIILPESIASAAVKEVYHKIAEPLFDNRKRKSMDDRSWKYPLPS